MRQSQATNCNTRSEPEEVTNVILNTVSFQLHILSFSSNSCSQLVLLETVKRFYFKKKPYLEKDAVFLVCSFLIMCMPLKDYNQNLISNFHPIQIKMSLKIGSFCHSLFSWEARATRHFTHNRYPTSILVQEIKFILPTCNTYFAWANIEIP